MIVAIVQARMSSTRLPGKVLKEVNGIPILKYELDRIHQSKLIDKVIVATSINSEDDLIEKFAKKFDFEIFRGDLNDVLGRYYECSLLANAHTVVRLTGDCPIIDAEIIDDVITMYQENSFDYVSNCLERTFPDGLDVEVFSSKILSGLNEMATSTEHREHVTKYIADFRNEFNIGHFKNDVDYSYVRWTLDTLEDFYFFKALIESRSSSNFSWKDLLGIGYQSKYLINSNQTIRFAMKKLEEVIQEDGDSLYVIENDKIIGTVSGGDIRRKLIYEDISNNEQISKIANPNFHFLQHNKKYLAEDLAEFDRYGFLPVLDDNKRFLEFRQIKDLLTLPNQVVLMAGGMGNRLKEITSSTPKPMLKIGGKPILETIIDQFSEQNFNSFYISVNHFADQIVDYFQDGDKKNVNVKYLHEKKRLGTAGCLSLIDEKLNDPFFVMNGDILTDISFSDMLKAHKENKNEITIGTVYFRTEVPYGVIKEDENSVLEIEEKPTQSSLVSAGIYVLNHDLIQEIPKDEYFDITQLFEKLLHQKRNIGVYKIQNYWLDIGHPEDYFKAQNDFENYFN